MLKVMHRLGVISLIAFVSTGCMQKMVEPTSPEASMAIIEPVVSGKMRVGLSFNTYSYHEKPPKVMFMNNYNRVACGDIKHNETGVVTEAKSFLGASQCYYPNLSPGTYTMLDYPMVQDGETYFVLFLRLHNTLKFEEEKLTFTIGPGEVKHMGTYVLNMDDSGSKLLVKSIDEIQGSDAASRAKLELSRAETSWQLGE